jgi:predicted O-methyltransferase YrrM
MRKIVEWIKKPTNRQYQDLLLRLSNIETALDCIIHSPVYHERDDLGFNGQSHRKQIFLDLLSAFDFRAIVETGTWLGNTTGFMAQRSNLPIYTCELNERFHALARMRLADLKNIVFELEDSREFLSNLSRTPLADQAVFFYLDAHWYEEHPLARELQLIHDRWKNFVIMVDDFQVPHDPGYRYDDYDTKSLLDMNNYCALFDRLDLVPFFPTRPSAEETGSKRGCVILARKGPDSDRLSRLPTLSRPPGPLTP